MKSDHANAWRTVLRDAEVCVRPITRHDEKAWLEVRSRNTQWLARWEASVPEGAGQAPVTFRELVRRLRRSARLGTTMPFVIEVDGQVAGQVTVSNIVRGSAQPAAAAASLAFHAAIRADSSRFIWPAPMPAVLPPLA